MVRPAMLSKKAARTFFLVGTLLCVVAFVILTIDTFAQIPKRTHEDKITPAVARGKELWDKSNCMGCHTIMGEGAYYAPELTLVYERRGAPFIHAMLTDPEKMYPGQRRMYKYDFSERDKQDLIAFFQWIGKVDLNGFPARPSLMPVAIERGSGMVADTANRPKVFNQLCIACHSLDGQGGRVGPALDAVGARMTGPAINAWLHDPAKIKPGTAMPKLPLTDGQIVELTAFLSMLKK